MSFLTPLYVLGTLAVLAPIVFHLIRQSPLGEVAFSSLMFLSPTPPRLTRRSRLDHLLLLLLRASALCLLAFAFARPFLRHAARIDGGDADRRRVAILIDVSASMRRSDIWTRAVKRADEVLSRCRANDQVALFAFDDSSRPLLGFEESATLDPTKRQAVVKSRLTTLRPTWGATDLGQALIDVVAAIEEVTDSSEKNGRMPRRVVLISDLQQGSRVEVLGDFEWPTDVELEVETVSATTSNAGLQWLADAHAPVAEAAGTDSMPRMRVSNDASSRREKFSLRWVDDQGAERGKPVDVYVPAGESRVVRVPLPEGPRSIRSLVLSGDQELFDNTVFLAVEPREEATVYYLGGDSADDHSGMLYYLQRVFQDSADQTVIVVSVKPNEALAIESPRSTPLVVLAAQTMPENLALIQQFAQGGGTVLLVATAPGRADALSFLAGVPPLELAEADVAGDVMLGEIAFDHPLFAPLAAAQFNDFTKIHFWKYRKIALEAIPDARVLARFENGDPAVLEKRLEKGRVVVMTSGWNPLDSQLARSSKFVPLMAAFLVGRGPIRVAAEDHRVHDRVALPVDDESGEVDVRKPDGSIVPAHATRGSFTETDLPGVYSIDSGGRASAFAVNLDSDESKTSPLPVETLEQFGARLANPERRAAAVEQRRQLQNLELESRQKLWRWLILIAIGVLIVETWLAGRLSRRPLANAEALAT